MFGIFKKKYPANAPDFSGLKTDMHSHLLPGIDDGSPDASTSFELKKGLEDLGFRQFITTPHVMWDLYKNTPDSISGAFDRLKSESQVSNLRPAAEYFMDEHFDQLVENDAPLITIYNKLVLVEFSFVSQPFDLKEKLFTLQIKGYQPVIAHPERYEYLSAKKYIYEELKMMGCLFQLNLLSLTGYYGKMPQELANWLIGKKYVDLLGTDLHHERHLDALRSSNKIMPSVERLLDEGMLLNGSLQV